MIHLNKLTRSSKLQAWIQVSRPKTLPLALSGILIGTTMAAARGYFRLDIFLLAMLTAVSFQVLANWANDYGDGLRGADNDDRLGPQRAVSSGALKPRTLLRGIILLSIASFSLGVLLTLRAFDRSQSDKIFLFIFMGFACVWAALAYTMGSSPYGYRARGDLAVFLFFGLLAVQGVYYLYDHRFMPVNFLPAVSIGAFSVAVLNLNNLRDHDSDQSVGKNTLVVRMGLRKSKAYHLFLFLLVYVSAMGYNVILERGSLCYLFLISALPVICHVKKVLKSRQPSSLRSELNRVALLALSFSLLFSLGELLSAIPLLNGT